VIDLLDASYPLNELGLDATGYFLTDEHMEWYREQYLSGGATGEERNVSPLRAASLACLPAACVVTAEMDPLGDEGAAYAALGIED
jgi:acetyl esterase